MANLWVDRPRHLPRQCIVCHRGDPAHGPYWEGPAFEANTGLRGGGEQTHHFYICTLCMRNALAHQGSPFREPWERARRLEEERGALEAQVAALEERLGTEDEREDRIAHRIAELIRPARRTKSA